MKTMLFYLGFLILTMALNGGTVQSKNILFQVGEVTRKNKALEVEYMVRNMTANDIWICESTDWKSCLNFQSTVIREDKTIIIKIKSVVVPSNVFLEEPIFARYRKIPPGESLKFTLNMKFPIYDYSPLKSNKKTSINLDDTSLIRLEIGFFKRNLEQINDCCLKTPKADELLVNCFWAAQNSEEFGSLEIKNSKWQK
jgi:hypothetical protein